MVWNLPAISVSVIVNMTDLRGLPMKQCTTRKESEKQMIDELRCRNGNLEINITSQSTDDREQL